VRTLFFLLLLANIGFLAWSYYGTGASTEAQLVEQQLNPQAIRVLSPEQRAALAAQRAKAAAPPAPPPPPPAPPPLPKVAVAACLELGAFNPPDVTRVQQALEPLALGPKLSQRRVDEIANFWVFIPPQRNRQAANQKAGELKKLGVGDFFVLQDESRFRFAVSLGVFKSEDAARARLAELRAKGVHSAQVGARETTVQKIYFDLRDVPDPVVVKLNELRQTFPGSELKECPAGEKGGPETAQPGAQSGAANLP
jgi:SPOR domain